MAKKKLDTKLLSAIAAAPGGFAYVSQADALPFLPPASDPALIEVNTAMLDPSDPGKAAARLSEAGKAMLNGAANPAVETPTPTFDIITNAVLPPSKRGNRGGGAKTIYPFDAMEVGSSFFVPVSAKHKDPLKQLGSTVSSANHKYAVKTGEQKVVERTKRGLKNKALLNPDGTKIKESVTIDVLKQTRHFTIRKVESGKPYGEWIAPSDGVLIARTM